MGSGAEADLKITPNGGTPLGLSSAEGASLVLVSEKFNGTNYREWAQSVRLAVGGRGKLGLISGTSKPPDASDSAALVKWETDNSLVASWLVNSMTPQIRRSFMFLPTARDIWDAVKESYSDGEDGARIYDLKTRSWQIKQGERDLTEFWLELVSVWQEIDLNIETEWSCPSDAARYKRLIEDERVFQFLAGLHQSLDDVRSRILARSPLPSTRDAFAEVRREASRRKVMLPGISSTLPSSEVSALVSRQSDQGQKESRGKVVCEHCRKTGHSKDKCWDLHGKPPDWKPRKGKSRGYQTTSDSTSDKSGSAPDKSGTLPIIDKDQLNKLLEMLHSLQSNQSPPSHNASVAKQGSLIGEDDWQC
ncbi:uncharacterized protein LOC129320121 [Prosopis cineraria]|uniref:uncharacterized protein LOC129320121 n=1 Tax=Prosopis cineraria TaxID=364024 RepID=UPI00240F3846|nr:uncharacterized protein LOC129320121 [Prosopis cineraria]